MKRLMFALTAAALVAGSTGCCGWHPFGHGRCNPWSAGGSGADCGSDDCGGGCATEYPGPGYDGAYGPGPGGYGGPAAVPDGGLAHGAGCGCAGCGAAAAQGFAAGPPSAQVTYPYYTTRGPRDFLARQPRSPGL